MDRFGLIKSKMKSTLGKPKYIKMIYIEYFQQKDSSEEYK